MVSDHRIVNGDRRNVLGEGLMWSPRRNTLFWVDILGQQLYAYHPGSGRIGEIPMPERIGWAIERRDHDGLVIGLKSGFALLNLEDKTITPIGNPEPDRPFNRLNDAGVDRFGRIWAGSKDDRDDEATGALYRLDPDFTWSRHDDGYGVTNGPAFSVDGATLFHTDSAQRTVFAFTLRDDGELTDKRVFLRFEDEWGYPDGMAVDRDGGLWIAHWGGGRVSRFDPGGKLERSIPLPASQISNGVFAGQALDRMFVTSAATGTTDEPFAGALFEVDPGVVGVETGLFAG